MFGYLLKTGIGAVVVYGVINVLEENKVFEKARAVMDEQLVKLVPNNLGFGSPSPQADPWRSTSDGRL